MIIVFLNQILYFYSCHMNPLNVIYLVLKLQMARIPLPKTEPLQKYGVHYHRPTFINNYPQRNYWRRLIPVNLIHFRHSCATFSPITLAAAIIIASQMKPKCPREPSIGLWWVLQVTHGRKSISTAQNICEFYLSRSTWLQTEAMSEKVVEDI